MPDDVTLVGTDSVYIQRSVTLQPAPYESLVNGVGYTCHREPGESIQETKERCKGFVDSLLDELVAEDIENFYPARKAKMRKAGLGNG